LQGDELPRGALEGHESQRKEAEEQESEEEWMEVEESIQDLPPNRRINCKYFLVSCLNVFFVSCLNAFILFIN
jgi:hypothetical protein